MAIMTKLRMIIRVLVIDRNTTVVSFHRATVCNVLHSLIYLSVQKWFAGTSPTWKFGCNWPPLQKTWFPINIRW